MNIIDPRSRLANMPSRLHPLRVGALFLLGGLAACAPLDSDEGRSTDGDGAVDQQTSEVVGGTKTTAYPSAGEVEDYCSGTLISRRAVLTAGHCVTNGQKGSFWTQKSDGSRTERKFTDAIRHPDYDTYDGADLAVLILANDVTDVTPALLGASPVWKGQPITKVGYGYTSFNGDYQDHTKYAGTNTIADLWDGSMFSYVGSTPGHANNCSGDSGGPAYSNAGAVIGVTSSGYGNQYCSTEGWDVRVDRYADWILSKIPAGSGGGTSKCATIAEGSSGTLSCSAGRKITKLTFASYGNPTGQCASFKVGSCNSTSTKTKLNNLCVGKTSCSVTANNATFGDPCAGVSKNLRVQYTCE